mgnify:CR=1 FL=1|jgi:hypothetical protein
MGGKHLALQVSLLPPISLRASCPWPPFCAALPNLRSASGAGLPTLTVAEGKGKIPGQRSALVGTGCEGNWLGNVAVHARFVGVL